MPRKRKLRVESNGQVVMPHRPEEPERDVLAAVLHTLNTLGDVIALRNSTGAYRKGAHWIQYGLGGKGGTDVIAFVFVRRLNVAVTVAIETKRWGKDAEEDQEAWMARMQRYGVVCGVATTVQQALDLIEEARRRARA